MRRVMRKVSLFSFTWSSGMGLLRAAQSMPARRQRPAPSVSSTRWKSQPGRAIEKKRRSYTSAEPPGPCAA